jgi:hypothetical protein
LKPWIAGHPSLYSGQAPNAAVQLFEASTLSGALYGRTVRVNPRALPSFRRALVASLFLIQ